MLVRDLDDNTHLGSAANWCPGPRLGVTGQVSGLRVVQDVLEDVPDVYFSRLTAHDVVRHRLVADIVDAYARYDAAQAAEPGRLPAGRARRDAGRNR